MLSPPLDFLFLGYDLKVISFSSIARTFPGMLIPALFIFQYSLLVAVQQTTAAAWVTGGYYTAGGLL